MPMVGGCKTSLAREMARRAGFRAARWSPVGGGHSGGNHPGNRRWRCTAYSSASLPGGVKIFSIRLALWGKLRGRRVSFFGTGRYYTRPPGSWEPPVSRFWKKPGETGKVHWNPFCFLKLDRPATWYPVYRVRPAGTVRFSKLSSQLVKFIPIYDLIVSGLSRGITQLDYISECGLELLCIRLA